MAEVKFILIGENQKLYWDGKSNTGTYLATLNSVKELYPGALIFTTYYKDDQHDTEEKHKKHELWANGKRYTLGGGLGELSLYTDTEDPWVYFSTGHTGAEIDIDPGTYYIKTRELNTTTHHYDPTPSNTENDDDYDRIVPDFTISEQELKSRSQSTGQNNNPIAEPNDVAKERTAYIYNPNEDGGQTKSTKASWYALSGNVDASNVYFPEGVQRTIKFGVFLDKDGDDIVIDGVNKNLKDLLEGYLVKEVWPTVNKPTTNKTPSTSYSVSHNAATPSSLTVTVNNAAPSSDNYILYGSTISASGSYDPTLKLDDGYPTSVTYGPNKITGITWGYYKMDGNTLDENYPNAIKPASKEISGTSVTGYFDYDDSETTQECTSKIRYKKNGDADYTNGTTQTTKNNADPITYTLNTLSPSYNNIPSTTLGSLKIGLVNTNNSFWSRTAYTSKEVSGDDITYTDYPTEIPATETICLNSNKGNSQRESGNPKKTVHSAESISNPASSASLSSASKSATDIENTYNIYVKVWDDTPNNRGFQDRKITSNTFSITWNPGYASSSLAQNGPLQFKVPVGFTVSAITLNGNPFTGNLTDFYESENLAYNTDFNSGKSGKYIKYQLIKSKAWTFGAHSSDASSQLSISFTKSGSITELDIPQQNN